jgi:pimeloyl-ACP methyl ester carboxylesterase
MDPERRKVTFSSGRERRAAWHYPAESGACVVMAPGYAVTKEAGCDRYAAAFQAAGYSVLAFDYRGFGESAGEPRLVARVSEQLADWDAAIGSAADLPEVDPGRLAIWGYSVSGAHVLPVAARHPELAAAVAISAPVDGSAASRAALRHQSLGAALRLGGRGLLDTLGSPFGAQPRLVPLVGERGTVAMLTAPDALDGPRALNAERYPEWQRQIAARSALRVGFYRPARFARRIECPLLVLSYEDDQLAPVSAAAKVARKAARAEFFSPPGGHFEFLLDGYQEALARQLEFLGRHLGTD